MPKFGPVDVSRAPGRATFVQVERPTIAPVPLIIADKPAAFQFLSGEKAQDTYGFPYMCCACAEPCPAHETNSKNAKEKVLASCMKCGLRVPGSLNLAISDANAKKRWFFKIYFCPASRRLMGYIMKRQNLEVVVSCGAMNCSCAPIKIHDVLACAEDVIVISDCSLAKAAERGFTMFMTIKDKSTMEAFDQGVENYNFFDSVPAFSDVPMIEPPPAPKAEKKARASVKEITKKKKPAAPKPKKGSGRRFIEEEADEGSESEDSGTENDD